MAVTIVDTSKIKPGVPLQELVLKLWDNYTEPGTTLFCNETIVEFLTEAMHLGICLGRGEMVAGYKATGDPNFVMKM